VKWGSGLGTALIVVLGLVLPVSVLNAGQIRGLAQRAGFRGTDLTISVAIAFAESGGDTNALNPTDNGGTQSSFGLWQISNGTHSPPSPNWADGQTNANLAWGKYTAAGRRFTPWGTYNSDAYKKFLPIARRPVPNPVHVPTAAEAWPWLNLANMTQHYGWNYYGATRVWEDGIDLGMPLHTPITSLTNGTVLDTGYYGGGGVVSVRSSGIPGRGVASVYYQHLDTIDVQPGAVVHIGDRLGLSGGQLRGGYHPVTCCSTGPHLEVGINNGTAGARSLWRSLGAPIDPLPWLQELVKNGPGPIATGPTAAIGASTDTIINQWSKPSGPVADSWLAICQRIDYDMHFYSTWSLADAGSTGWLGAPDFGKYFQENSPIIVHNIAAAIWRATFVVVGLLVIVLVLANLIKGPIEAATPALVRGAAAGATAGVA
jgi:murein DD-endopeptidase MepM/ murein hydrolase activator NlpD